MPGTHDPRGTLDITKLKPADYSKLPKELVSSRAGAKGDGSTDLFPALPDFDDVTALTKAQPVDGSLYACLSSILNGLESGPARIMGMFRSVNQDDVVVRVYLPRRPSAELAPQPLYFILNRSHAELAIKKRWVGPTAPTWLALYAALYYSFIEDRREFYARKDLGGADNAAWLVLAGRDSSRAKYVDPKPDSESKADKAGASGDTEEGSAGARRIVGLGASTLDAGLCMQYVFAGNRKIAKQLTKEWATCLAKLPRAAATGLPAGLSPRDADKLTGFAKWLEQRGNLSQELVARLLLFLEANGALSAEGKARYGKAARTLFAAIKTALRQRNPVALALPTPGRAKDGPATVEIADVYTLALPGGSKERALQYIALRPANRLGTRFRWRTQAGFHLLVEEPSKKADSWLELDQVLLQATQVLVGADASAALAPPAKLPSYTVDMADIRNKSWTPAK